MKKSEEKEIRAQLRQRIAAEPNFRYIVREELERFEQGEVKRIEGEKLLTSHDVGRLLQMDPSSVVKWVNDGLLASFRTPGGHRRIRADALRAFLQEHGMYVPDELRS